MDADINGYVESNPDVNIFLLADFFISILFSINGKQDLNTCSSLKFALFVIKPFACIIPSILFIQYSNSLISST